MPTVSQHYGHHAAPRTDKSALATRQAARPRSAYGIRRCGLDGAAPYGLHIKAGYPGRARRRSHCARAIARAACKPSSARGASDGDEAFVRDLCVQYGLPLCVEHAYFDDESGNIEAAAREVRYAAARRYVRELCAESGAPRTAARICTAHTSSDRAETFFDECH